MSPCDMDANNNTGLATGKATDLPKAAVAGKNHADLIIDQVLQEMGIVLDEEKRQLLKSSPESGTPVEQVREWAAAVARHRMVKFWFDGDKITWRGSDLHNCILYTLGANGYTCRPDVSAHNRCKLFDHQYLSPSLRWELNGDAVLLVHVRKAAARKGAQWRREQPRPEAGYRYLYFVRYYVLVFLNTLLYNFFYTWYMRARICPGH